MAWGSANAGIDDIVDRVRRNDATLTSLYLMRTRNLDDAACGVLAEALAANTTISELHLSSHPVSASQARSLASGLAKNACVRHVSIGNSTLGDEALLALCDGFRMCRSLESLDLEKKGLTSASCGSLAAAVLSSAAIRRVMLSDNDVGGRGIADFLRCASRLESLELSACVNDSAQWTLVTQAMAESFPEARSLRHLELDRNMLDERSAGALANSLVRLPSLESLSLNGNLGLGPGGVRALAFPTCLRRLDIGATGAGDEGLCGLADLVAHGRLPKLEYVNVCGCGATSRGLGALLDGLRKAHNLGGGVFVEVDAGGNLLGDHVENTLRHVIRCRRLQSLRLHGCSMGAVGAQALARVFGSRASGFPAIGCAEGNDGSNDGSNDEGTAECGHALRDLDISGNCIPEADLLSVLDALPRAVDADGPFPLLKTLIIAANPEVEGSTIAERVEALADLDVVIMRAANDDKKLDSYFDR